MHKLAGVSDSFCGTGAQRCMDCASEGLNCFNQLCEDLGPCVPGEQLACGYCGVRECEGDGRWGSCFNPGECQPGDRLSGDTCGTCGTTEYTCLDNCTWELTTTCEEVDFCCTGDDDGACGVIDCSSWYVARDDAGGQSCYAKADIVSDRCEGVSDCKDSNSEDCIEQPDGDLQYTCGICQFVHLPTGPE